MLLRCCGTRHSLSDASDSLSVRCGQLNSDSLRQTRASTSTRSVAGQTAHTQADAAKGQRVFSNNVVESSAKRKTPSSRIHQSKRLKVAVDVDEVLGRFLHSLNKYCLEEFHAEYDISDYKEYNFAAVWGCTRDEANHRVHEFFKSHHFAVGILPIPGARPSLQRLQSDFDLVVVTSRQHIIQQPTEQWIETHFPGIFQEVHFGNHWALSGTSKKKSEICHEVGASVLIDDNPQYAMDCAEAGIDVLLYDWQMSYPWAKTTDGPSHSRIARVQDWNEVESQLSVLATKS